MTKRILVFFMVLLLSAGTTFLFSRVEVGEEVLQRFETPHPYDGVKGVVWEQEFHSPGAGYIAIHFSNFDLAKGDYLLISSPDGRFEYKYKEKGKKVKHGTESISEFWATHVPRDRVIVKLVSKNKRSDYGFVIDKWARGYDRGYIDAVMSGLEEDALDNIKAVCSSDDKEWAKCYEGTTMYNKSKAVCRLLIGGTSACTGWLLGSEGHVMTNNHCIGTTSGANNTDYEFMAEGATCSTGCASWGACPGTVEASAGTMIQTDSSLDYTLILLPSNVTSTYGYMQFRDTLPTIGERIYIPQHPSAYGKQLAVVSDTDGPYAKVYSTNESPCSGGPGDIGYYADTAGGSSGSPVLGYGDHLVVALHHCADCPNRGVPIPSIISDLGSNLPANAVGSTGPPQPPVADFTADKTLVQVGGSVSFTDLSSNNPTEWSWSFEGGTPSTSTAQNPTVTYNTIGTFSVTLTATNEAGSDTETKTDYITVEEVVIEYCTSSGNNQNYEYIAGVEVGDLYNTSGASGYTDYTSMAANLTAGGSVAVSLTPGFVSSSYTEYWKIWIDYNIDGDFADSGEEVFSGSGSSTVSGNFTVPSSASGTTRMRVSMSYSSAPPYCGTFTYGEVEDYTVIIGGGDPPVANFSADATTITEGQSVNFTDMSTNNPTSWSWTFEGGTPSTSTVQNPTVTYNTIGTYSVSLTATNAAGSDTETKPAYITAGPPPPPEAGFSASATTVIEGQTVTFTDTSTNNPTSRSWTFAGGTPSSSTAQNPTVTYNTEGIYDVTLTATNSGGSDTETKTDYITVNPDGVGITFEAGTVSNVGSSWQTVNLQNTYSSMVVVCGTHLANSSTLPAVCRVRNASGSSFDVMVQNPSGSALSGYTVHYTVVEEGVYTQAADGVTMEAVIVNSTLTAENNSWVMEQQSYQNTYTNPVVLGQVMSYNDSGWSVFWASSSSRTSPPTSSSFYGGKNVGEDPDATRSNETVGYIVIEQGSGTINGIPYTAEVGADAVRGPDNTSTGYTYTFSSVPNASTAIVSAAGMDGGNGGWPVLYGPTPLTDTSITIVFDEDQVNDSERKHTTEQVAFAVFGQ